MYLKQLAILPLLGLLYSSLEATRVTSFSDLVRGGKTAMSAFQDTINAHKFVVLKCSMKNCAPCKKIAPQFEALATKYSQSAEFIEVDIHLFDDVIRPYTIKKAPSFIIFYKGRHLLTLRGSESINQIAKALDTQLHLENAAAA